MNSKYAAIIIDVYHSREFDDEHRFYIQDKLFSIIKFVNDYYVKEIVKNFEFSSGDSIQALFNNVADAFSCYWLIKNLFYPYQIRCGIGYGKINQRILDSNYNSTNMLDGEAYHNAISALNDCKLEKYCFLLYSDYVEKDNLVNQIMRTIELLYMDHTNKQADVSNLFNLLYPLEIKYEGQNVNSNAKFIIDKLKQNILSYEVDNISSIELKELFPDEVRHSYLKKDKKNHEFFDLSFSTKLSSVCSILLNVSRQNIEKMRIAGKFDEIRKLECLVLDYTKKEYVGGSKWIY